MTESIVTPKENPLAVAPVGGLIRRFALPAIVSMLVNTIYNITDQIFIGHTVGILGNAATNTAFPVVILSTGLAQLVGIGTAANFNLSMGAKAQDAARSYVGTGLVMSAALGILLGCLIFMFQTPVLLLCGATENVLPYAQRYLGITACGLPFLLFFTANSMLIRADGAPSYAMRCMVSGAVLNILLDALFMLGFGWGMEGAALATVMAQIISFLVCIRYFSRFQAFPIVRTMLRIRRHEMLRIAKLGLSNFLNQIIMMTVGITLNNILTHYGAASVYGADIPLAVAGIVTKLNSVLIAFTVGLAQGCQPIFSFNMGAGNYGRIKETYRKGLVFALLLSMAIFLVFQLFPRQITAIFGGGSELYFDFAEKYLRIYLMMVCISGVQPLTVNYFTAIGSVRTGLMLSLSRQGLFLLPLLILLPYIFGLDGALYAGPIAEILAFILAMSTMYRHWQQLTRMEWGEVLEQR